MNTRHLFLFIPVCCLLSCSGNKEGDGIPRETMKHILYDMNAAEVYSTMVKREDSATLNRGKNSDSLALYYNEILAHYKVTREQFDKSMQWYKAHPAKLDSLYNEMLPELEKVK